MAPDDLIGTVLGGYRIEEKIGSGATGAVYRAVPTVGGAPIALKVLDQNLGSISGLERRFAREARVLKKLSHPNIVEITDFGIEDGRTFIAMELLEGITLEDELANGSIDPPRAIALYEPILAALAEAHDHEVVHRDLKPANVFLLTDGTVKLLDFGLAKMLSVDETVEEATLTRKGRIVGTPAYMAPEQITGVFIDVRADVYALGVMLFELLADRRPFTYDRRSELLRAHLLEPVPSLEKAREGLWVHEDLAAFLAKALAKDAAERFENGRAMLVALRALPEECVRLDAQVAGRSRVRKEATSAVISDEERKAVTESANATASGSAPVDESSPASALSVGSERDRITAKLPAQPAPEPSTSTARVWLVVGVAVCIGAAIWVIRYLLA